MDMKKPIIGITGNHFLDPNDTISPHLSYCATVFVTAVQEAGGLPLILPIGEPDAAKSYVSMVDKLIFTGGQHVSPHFYQEEQTIVSEDYLVKRDIFELALIKEALAQSKPIFTVCRGTQLFNVAMGGGLFQDIPNHWQAEKATELTHGIDFEADSILSRIYGAKNRVNSFHHQAIKQLAPSLKILGCSTEDSTIEAIGMVEPYPYIGVQWHPELLFQSRLEEKELFHYVINEL